MLKKHLKKAAALLVSIATILGTLPTMAASNEEEMIEESAVTTVTDNEAKKLSSDEALDMLKSESQIKADEDNAAEKEKAHKPTDPAYVPTNTNRFRPLCKKPYRYRILT